MSQNYTVTEVRGTRDWQTGQGMPFRSYDVMLQEGPPQVVELVQKPETPAPSPGQQLFGDVNPGRMQGTYRFKKAQQGQQQSFNGGGSVPSRGYEDDGSRQRSIVRQHSQGCALQYFAIAGKLPSRDELVQMIDWFAQDAHNAGEAPVSNTPAPQRPSVPESDVPADFTGLEPSTASGATGDSDPF